jgi:CRP-like cAMP-binding protein
VKAELEQVELGRIEQIRSLRGLFGLQGVSTPSLAALAAHTTPVRIPRGFELATEGQPVDEMYVVIEGELATSRAGKPLGVFGPRSAVGALAAFAHDRHGYRCVALRDTIALAMRAEEVLEVFEDHFEMLLVVLRAVARESIDTRLGLPGAGFSETIRTDIPHPLRPLDLVERLFCLRESFAVGLTHLDALAEIARTSREVRYPAGTRLWSVGDGSEHMLTLVSGVVSAHTQNDTHFRFGPRDILGSLDMVAAVPRWYDAIVEEDAVALSHDVEIVIDLWEDHTELGFGFLQLMAAMLLSLRERLYDDPTAHERHRHAAP